MTNIDNTLMFSRILSNIKPYSLFLPPIHRYHCVCPVLFLQSAAVTFLRDAMSTKCGLTDAATLVLISARPRQLLLNTFSHQQVELPALDIESLRTALDAVAMGSGAAKSGTGVAGSGTAVE